ncbi:hypothetical protein BaRGS_00009672 [Batillaria attramentaria]|uniref:Uncharacterized protein n=1 Tax=Batillaria attramentaria TaxID=370345 RepID=A0ABD0LID3_9CAEN
MQLLQTLRQLQMTSKTVLDRKATKNEAAAMWRSTCTTDTVCLASSTPRQQGEGKGKTRSQPNDQRGPTTAVHPEREEMMNDDCPEGSGYLGGYKPPMCDWITTKPDAGGTGAADHVTLTDPPHSSNTDTRKRWGRTADGAGCIEEEISRLFTS